MCGIVIAVFCVPVFYLYHPCGGNFPMSTLLMNSGFLHYLLTFTVLPTIMFIDLVLNQSQISSPKWLQGFITSKEKYLLSYFLFYSIHQVYWINHKKYQFQQNNKISGRGGGHMLFHPNQIQIAFETNWIPNKTCIDGCPQ